MKIALLAIDLAKNVFQLHGEDEKGHVLLKKLLRRDKLLPFIANLPPCLIAMESCATSNYWARKFMCHGHQVKLISPQHVTPFVRRNKNDEHDAQTITEAARRPDMQSVSVKTVEQQDIQSLHRIRQRLIKSRSALCNQIRGLLLEYGVVIAAGIQRLRSQLPLILSNSDHELTSMMRCLVQELYDELTELDAKVKRCDVNIKTVFKNIDACQRIATLHGIGPIIATAVIATIGDPGDFKNGRQFAAFLGLVPKHRASGEKRTILNISKRGDVYLRTLLIHGARARLMHVDGKTDPLSSWASGVKQRRGTNLACVALANKQARKVWAILANKQPLVVAKAA